MPKLRIGKIPIDILSETVLKMTGAPSSLILTPSQVGLDFAAIKIKDAYLLVSADPVTGVAEGIGTYAVNVSANDVATSGHRPQFIETVVLMPEGSGTFELKTIASQMHLAAKSLGVAIVGGHTEVTPGLRWPIVAVTAFGVAQDYVSAAGAKPGDTLMMTKSAGVEGTAAILSEAIVAGEKVPRALARAADRFVGMLSVAQEAERAYATGFVHAMHDCTEGGVLGACYEMSLASRAGFVLREAAVPVATETRKVCSMFHLDPLKLIGSGSVLMAVKNGREEMVKEAMKGACEVAAVGEFTGKERVLVRESGVEVDVESPPDDELWRVLGESGRAKYRLRP